MAVAQALVAFALHMYLPNAARTDSRKSSNVLKYFRCVAFFFVFLQSFSMGLKSVEKEGRR